jgi:hypothetical protein
MIILSSKINELPSLFTFHNENHKRLALKYII